MMNFSTAQALLELTNLSFIFFATNLGLKLLIRLTNQSNTRFGQVQNGFFIIFAFMFCLLYALSFRRTLVGQTIW